VAEVVTVSEADRLAALERAGLVHPRAEAVTAPLFSSGGFFLAADKVQVKYEMLRAHLAGDVPVTVAAAAHGYSRAAFYLVAASFEQAGMAGLLDERRGRRGPVKLRPEITEFIRSAPPTSGAVLAEQVAERFGVVLHRRTIERVRGPQAGRLPAGLAAARFARRGLAGLIAWPAAEPDFRGQLAGAARPPWTPGADPREQALAAACQFLLGTAGVLAAPGGQVRQGWS
jgi:hypothetical protein